MPRVDWPAPFPGLGRGLRAAVGGGGAEGRALWSGQLRGAGVGLQVSLVTVVLGVGPAALGQLYGIAWRPLVSAVCGGSWGLFVLRLGAVPTQKFGLAVVKGAQIGGPPG